MIEIGRRRRSLPAPPHIVWQSLTEPRAEHARPWLELLDDEVEPTIVEAVAPTRVVWSSIWPSRPHDRIEFDLEPDGGGTALCWTVLAPDDPDDAPDGAPSSIPDASKTGHIRYRMNVLINQDLRYSYGQ
jgi:hypothetical protein